MKKIEKSSVEGATIADSVDASKIQADDKDIKKELSTVPQKTETNEDEAAPLEALLLDDSTPYETEAEEEEINFDAFLNDFKAHISNNLVQSHNEEKAESVNPSPAETQTAAEALKKDEKHTIPEAASISESQIAPEATQVNEKDVAHNVAVVDEQQGTPEATEADEKQTVIEIAAVDEKTALQKKETKAKIKKSSSSKPKEKKTKPKASPKKDNWEDEISLLPEIYELPDEEDNIFRDCPLPEEEPTEDAFFIGREIYSEDDDEIQLSIKFEEPSTNEITSPKDDDKFTYDPERPRFIDGVYDFLELFVITLVCVMILTTFVFKHSIVEGRSMQNTLEEGDSLIITDLFYSPKRFDIVVFEDYSTSLKKAVVKRVIGLPGEKVEVKINDNLEYEVYINDELLPEAYAYNAPDSSAPATGVWHVEEGEVFVMGDNRYNSTDSRDGSVGPIDVECILGKVVLRFYPFDKFGKVE